MRQPVPPVSAPVEPHWDIAFTRLARAVLPHVAVCVQALTLRFEAIGLRCDSQLRQTPRGLSTFLAVVGDRGLLFIVDLCLIDGMAVGRQAAAMIDIRLLDACGDVVAACSPPPAAAVAAGSVLVDTVIAAAGLPAAVTNVYVTALAHFVDLV